MDSAISMMVPSVKLLVPAVMVPTVFQLIATLLATLISTVSCFLLRREGTVTPMNTEGFVRVVSIVLIAYVLMEMLLQLPAPQLHLLQLLPLQPLLQVQLLLQKHVLLVVQHVMIMLALLTHVVLLPNVEIWIFPVELQYLNVNN